MFPKINLFVVFLISTDCSCTGFVVKSVIPLDSFNELFFREHGWIGADGIYSCKISETMSIWHFADTFIGDRIENKRRNWTLIRNSVGIQTESDNSSSFHFHWTNRNISDSFYLPPDNKGWLWPKACVYYENKLHIFLIQHEMWDPHIGWDYGPIASWHAVISNPSDDPIQWIIKYNKTPFLYTTVQNNITFDSSILRHDDYFYWISGWNFRDLTTGRIKVNQIGDYDSYEFFNDGEWVDSFRDASLLFNAAGEYSVHYDNGLQKFVAIYSESFLSTDILARTAPTPSGPWSDPLKLYTVPEMYEPSNIFCYAGKVHPEMSGKYYFVVSYACNSFVMNDVIQNATLYMPKFIQINWSLNCVRMYWETFHFTILICFIALIVNYFITPNNH